MILFSQITDSAGASLTALVRAYWPVWLIAGLGFVGIYGLLPQARRSRAILGGLSAAAAVLLAGLWLVGYEGVWPEKVLFYSFALLAVIGALLMLSQRNPVHAALAFALVVLSTCGLFLLLAAPFLMAATIIIYAGAIVVTFLFVIMLAQQEGLTSADARSREPFLASLAGFVLLGSLWCVLDKTYNVEPLVHELRQVAEARAWDDVERLWAAPGGKAGEKTLIAIDRLKQAFPGGPVENLEPAWSKRDLAGLKRGAQALLAYHEERRHRQGALELPAKDGEAPPMPTLPARNVAALGNALFTTYLVPVELAGVLLLVATIGAIVIAGRRGEGLR